MARDRGLGKVVRVQAGSCRGDNSCLWLKAVLLQPFIPAEQEQGSAVIDGGGIAGSDGAVLFEDSLQLGEFGRITLERLFICCQDLFTLLALLHNRDDFISKNVIGNSRLSQLIGANGKVILLLRVSDRLVPHSLRR